MTEDEMNVPKRRYMYKKCGFSSRLYCECNETSAGKMYLQKNVNDMLEYEKLLDEMSADQMTYYLLHIQ